MTDAENLVLEIVRRIQHELALMRDDMSGLRSEMAGIKQHIAAFMSHEITQDGDIAALKVRVERIERRLDLID